MTIYADLYPTNKFPEKSQIEAMYKVAYRMDPLFFDPMDVGRFGLNVEKLQKFGEVEMRESLDRCRKHVNDLWERMNKQQRVAFLLAYFYTGARYLTSIMKDLGKVVGKELSEKEKFIVLCDDVTVAVTEEV